MVKKRARTGDSDEGTLTVSDFSAADALIAEQLTSVAQTRSAPFFMRRRVTHPDSAITARVEIPQGQTTPVSLRHIPKAPHASTLSPIADHILHHVLTGGAKAARSTPTKARFLSLKTQLNFDTPPVFPALAAPHLEFFLLASQIQQIKRHAIAKRIGAHSVMGQNAYSLAAQFFQMTPGNSNPRNYHWLHLLAHSLGGKEIVENFILGTAGANFCHYVLENIALSFVQKFSLSIMKIECDLIPFDDPNLARYHIFHSLQYKVSFQTHAGSQLYPILNAVIPLFNTVLPAKKDDIFALGIVFNRLTRLYSSVITPVLLAELKKDLEKDIDVARRSFFTHLYTYDKPSDAIEPDISTRRKLLFDDKKSTPPPRKRRAK